MKKYNNIFFALVSLLFIADEGYCSRYTQPPPPDTPSLRIIVPDDSSRLIDYSARELRRYIYLLTGRLLPIESCSKDLPEWGDLIVVGTTRHKMMDRLIADAWIRAETIGLKNEEYVARELNDNGRKIQILVGGDDVGVLYAAYRFVENNGVRFYLHGDELPQERLVIKRLPSETKRGAELLVSKKPEPERELKFLNETGKPLFVLRGIQPFHDFPEGPDWWNYDEYMQIISQLPKLRMNFIGLHTYPEKHPNAEPTVWIGLPEDVNENGTVKFAYPASYQNTLRGNWGYRAKKTGDFTFGSANIFERDDFGAEVMFGLMPEPKTPEGCIEVFNRTGDLLKQVFTHAHRLGIKTCAGTETPLIIPQLVAERIKSKGKDPKSMDVVRELYQGIFERITKAYPLDYYWFWTPEGWTWEGVKPEQITNTLNDLQAAIDAHRKVNPPFRLATCGWVLGPQQDRALFDKVLPPDVALSCINRNVGRTPVDKGFARVKRSDKWAIPWLEDDPALTQPQLWVGRMRRDAADAYKYGCNGLMGIHWRTRVLSPNILALAYAAWNQSPWNTNLEKNAEIVETEGPTGGKYAPFPNVDFADTDEDVIYQSVRYDVSNYKFKLPNGKYTVTLKFCEPHYNEKGKRIFGVKIQDKVVIENLDIFEKVGKNRAIDFTFKDNPVTNNWLVIEFIYVREYPAIAGIVIEGEGITRKINAGGPAYKDYAADWKESEKEERGFEPVNDFYLDWASSEFGKDVGPKAAEIFSKVDCKLPRPADWFEGPGAIRPDKRSWEEVSKEYTFVHEFEALKPLVKQPVYKERYNYWLNTFKYMETMAKIRCVWNDLTNELGAVKQIKDENERKQALKNRVFPIRKRIIEDLRTLYSYMLETVTTTGEMGTVANWEQHIYPELLTKPAEEMEKILGGKLPSDLNPPLDYFGNTRIIIPAKRTSLLVGEPLNLKIIVLSAKKPKEVAVFWRQMGDGVFRKSVCANVNRGVYKTTISAMPDADIEYYVRVTPSEGSTLFYPITAPLVNQTLVRIKN